MSNQTSFSLRGRNPDVLTCIANLSNDEVFTPPEFANQMLDTLTEAWAAENNGANLWSNKTIRFLDPVTKTGVFLREITSRLTKGLSDEIPDLKERVNHILTKQVFGIGITQLTSLLARRSLYCSKQASGKHSIATGFNSDDGNIWFERIEHSWNNGRCIYCGCGKSQFDRTERMETHAYALIHTHDVQTFINRIFGENMKFDVVIGNPPYQIEAEGNTRTMPIYQKFVEAAIAIDPQYIVMITPSRWFAGGLGLNDFRQRMLSDRRISVLIDYPDASDVFPGVEIKGGVSYFLWSSAHSKKTMTQTIRASVATKPNRRALDEFDVLVRESAALPILRKILKTRPETFADLVSPQKPFGLLSNFSKYTEKPSRNDYRFYGVRNGKRVEAWVDRRHISMNSELANFFKVLIPEAGSDGGKNKNDMVLGRPWVVPENSVCTQTFMFVCANNQVEAKNIESYISTKFFRFIVSLRKISQHTKADTYRWVPQQSWDREWSDETLYKKYDLTNKEIEYIEAVIRPMEVSKESSDE